LKTVQVDPTTVELSWAPPDKPNGEIIEYKIIYYGYKQGESEKIGVSYLRFNCCILP